MIETPVHDAPPAGPSRRVLDEEALFREARRLRRRRWAKRLLLTALMAGLIAGVVL
jgi:hypothetical protein